MGGRELSRFPKRCNNSLTPSIEEPIPSWNCRRSADGARIPAGLSGRDPAARAQSGLSFELPRRPHLAAEPAVGFQIVHKLFLDRIPFQLLAGAQGDDTEVANAHRAMADFGGANRLLAAAHTLDEVSHVIIRHIEP